MLNWLLILGVCIWTVLSIFHFISLIGDKYSEMKWRDYLTLAPAFVVCFVVGRFVDFLTWFWPESE